jgi:hypothetical protein
MLQEPTIAPVGESTVVGGPTRVEPVEVDPDVRSGLVDERDVVPEVPALGPGAPLPEPPAPPRLRLGPPPATDRLRGWIVTLTLTLIAGVVRFVGLDRPTDGGTPVFDEKHYVPQAWQMLRNGGVEDNPGYELVVHPRWASSSSRSASGCSATTAGAGAPRPRWPGRSPCCS